MQESTTEKFNADNYANALTGLGTEKDKSSFGRFVIRRQLGTEVINDLYEQDAIAARVVDRLVDDGTREGFTIAGEDEAFDFASVKSQLEDLDALNAVADAWRWSRLYGGALLVMNVNDGQTFDKPLDLSKATRLSSLQVIESPFVSPTGFNPGMGARAFRRPKWYDITLPFGSGTNVRQIHRSRVIRFDGVRVAPTRMIQNNGWGPSVLDRVHTELSQLGEVMGYCRNVMHDISIQVYKLEGFRDMLCGTAKDQTEIRGVLQTIKTSIDLLHVLALDTKDDFVTVDRSVTGLEALVDKFVDGLVRATNMPRTVLLGETPSGLNASGDSEIRSWFDFVSSQQNLTLTPVITRLLEVIFAIRENKGQDVPSQFTVEYGPLWQPTQQEKADTFLKTAQGDQIYMEFDVQSSDEVRARLISNGELTPLESPRDEPAPPEFEEEEIDPDIDPFDDDATEAPADGDA